MANYGSRSGGEQLNGSPGGDLNTTELPVRAGTLATQEHFDVEVVDDFGAGNDDIVPVEYDDDDASETGGSLFDVPSPSNAGESILEIRRSKIRNLVESAQVNVPEEIETDSARIFDAAIESPEVMTPEHQPAQTPLAGTPAPKTDVKPKWAPPTLPAASTDPLINEGALARPTKTLFQGIVEGRRESKQVKLRIRDQQLADANKELDRLNGISEVKAEEHIKGLASERYFASGMEAGLLHLPNPYELNALVRYATANILTEHTGVGLHSDEEIASVEHAQTRTLFNQELTALQRANTPFTAVASVAERRRLHLAAAERVRERLADVQSKASSTVYVDLPNSGKELMSAGMVMDEMEVPHREKAFALLVTTKNIPEHLRDIEESTRTLKLKTRIVPDEVTGEYRIDPEADAIGRIVFDPGTIRENVDPSGRDQRYTLFVGKGKKDTYAGNIVAEMRIRVPEPDEVIRTEDMSEAEYDRRLDNPTFTVTAELEPRVVMAEAWNVLERNRSKKTDVMGKPLEIPPMHLMLKIAEGIRNTAIPGYRQLAQNFHTERTNAIGTLRNRLMDQGYERAIQGMHGSLPEITTGHSGRNPVIEVRDQEE